MKTTVARFGNGAGIIGSSFLALLATGCGGSGPPHVTTYKVEGQVLLPDGKPLTTGRVTIVPTTTEGKALPASGDIGIDGRFTLTTRDSGDGAAPGEYKVRINTPPVAAAYGKAKLPFPQKYSDIDNTDLAVTIRPESNKLDPFVLK